MPPNNPFDLLICSTCGTQFSTPTREKLPSCKICDDPRQYVPPTGQAWTTLTELRNSKDPSYKNIFTPDPIHGDRLISIHTEPRVAIGQRAYLCRLETQRPPPPPPQPQRPSSAGKAGEEEPEGKSTFNVLWDCIAYIDDETVSEIKRLGGIDAIVISHPHYFTAHVDWADIFKCPVYLSAEDEEWAVRRGEAQVLFGESSLSFSPQGVYGGDDGKADIVAIKTGGHFPGSTVLWWRSLKTLLIADTIAIVPSARYWVDRPPGTASFTFMWSYPNMIPLSADNVHGIWKAIKHTEFDIARGAFIGMDTDTDSKKRLLDSAQIFVKAMGYLDHAIHQEECF